MANKQLITACKKKDINAQRELYELYSPRMMGLCLKYCKDYDAAQDLLHDGFFTVFTKIKSYSGRGSFEGWMKRIFINIFLENFRKEKSRGLLMVDINESNVQIEDENIERFINNDISEDLLLSMIQELPYGYRTVFNLYVFEEMSHKEIGKKLGIKESASRSQFSRAKIQLKNKINSYLASINEPYAE